MRLLLFVLLAHAPGDQCELHLNLSAGQLDGPRAGLNLDLHRQLQEHKAGA